MKSLQWKLHLCLPYNLHQPSIETKNKVKWHWSPGSALHPWSYSSSFVSQSLAHLSVFVGALWSKKGPSQTAHTARNLPVCARKSCRVGAFCVVIDKCSQIASPPKPITGLKWSWWPCNCSLPLSVSRLFCRSQNNEVKSRYLRLTLQS